MSYIDWSDPEGLFDMLVEYVSDEKTESHGDARRVGFLGQLHARLMAAQETIASAGLPQIMIKLDGIVDGISPEFREDPVVSHLTACLEELERINEGAR